MRAHLSGALGVGLLVFLSVPTRARANEHATSNRYEAMRLVDRIENGDEVQSCVERLHFLGEERYAAAKLEQAADAPDERVRRSVAFALANLGVKSAEGTLAQLSHDSDGATRMSAVQGLGRLHSRDEGILRALLKDPTLGVRREAARALGQTRDPKMGRPLMELARREDEPEVRATALEAVGFSGDHSQVKALEAYLTQSSESARLAAARALCLLGEPKGLAIAQKMLSSPEPTERRAGLALLEGAPAKVQRPFLKPLLDHPDLAISGGAARMLYQSGDRKMAVWLVMKAEGLHGDQRLRLEDEIDQLHLSEEQRHALLREGGYK